jgi:hypothetical protein
MLCVALDNSSIDDLVVGIKRGESSFNRAMRGLQNDLALLVALNVLKNMLRGVLQPILRPTGFTQLRLLNVHNLFKDCVEQPMAATSSYS